MLDLSKKFKDKKILFVTGGVLSGIGKGATASSIALLLNNMGQKTLMQKADPYINVGAGFLSPFEHGEVFVCADGTEADLDLGHYMRIADVPLSKLSSFTSGHIYKELIDIENKLEIKGETIQVIPHVVQSIINKIYAYFEGMPSHDIIVVEIGGTVGDLESQPFMEAIRRLKHQNPYNVFVAHVAYVPEISWSNEFKTKPAQHSVRTLISQGVCPDILLCRTERVLDTGSIVKLSRTCCIDVDKIINIPNFKESLYEIPLMLQERGICKVLKELLKTSNEEEPKLEAWNNLISKIKNRTKVLNIGIVGKYVSSPESYKSLYESLDHAGIHSDRKINIIPISETEDFNILEKEILNCDGVILPGGFGYRGWRSIVKAAEVVLEKKIPTLCICLGMQALTCFLIEKLTGKVVSSAEFKDDEEADIFAFIARENSEVKLGEHECSVNRDSLLYDVYKSDTCKEIFRHRYYLDPEVLKLIEDNKLAKITGVTLNDGVVASMEVEDHPWCIAVQHHPELKSTPLTPHKLIHKFIDESIKNKKR